MNQSLDQSGVPARIGKKSAWATDDGPTMYSQERQQNDAQTSNTRKQERRDESSAQPAAGNSLRNREVHPFGRRKLEFRNMQISDSGYFEEVFRNSMKKVNLAEDAPPLEISKHTNKTNIVFDLENVYVGIMKAAIHMGPDCTEILEVCKNTNFEELQNLFDITQKLVHKQGEILNVTMTVCISFMDEIVAGS